jgi:hypothetical protein
MWWLKSGLVYAVHAVLVVALMVPVVGLALWLGNDAAQVVLLSSRKGWVVIALVAWKTFAPPVLGGLALHMAGMAALHTLRPARVGAVASALWAAVLVSALFLRGLGWPLVLFLGGVYCSQAALLGWQLRRIQRPTARPSPHSDPT